MGLLAFSPATPMLPSPWLPWLIAFGVVLVVDLHWWCLNLLNLLGGVLAGRIVP
jgi:sensor domain CHASE-containing protein